MANYSLSFAELIDRMNIIELKIIYSKTPEAKQAFINEMEMILGDIDEHGQDANILRAACALAMVNVTIWHTEDFMRQEVEGKELTDQDKIKAAESLIKTHRLNADRGAAKARIQNITKGRVDAKLNYISGLWNIKY